MVIWVFQDGIYVITSTSTYILGEIVDNFVTAKLMYS